MSRRILIVRTDRVGDVVMITPMIRELRRTFPDGFIATLTQPYTKDVLLNNPHLDVMLTDDLKKESFWKVVKEVKKYRFTDALLVLPTERAAYQLFFAGIRNRIGVGRKLYEIITFMKSVSRHNYIPLRHEADYCMDLARRLGVVTNNIQPEIFLTPAEKLEAQQMLQNWNINPNSYKIILHTGTKGSAPNWNEDNYYNLLVKMIEKLKELNYFILLTAREMSQRFRQLVSQLNNKRIVIVDEKISNLRDFIKIISQMNLVICSSTGPIHLADALNIRCIGIHCHRNVSSAKHWGVLNSKSINLEVPAEFCDKYCSKDKSICKINEGLNIEDVLKHI
ncbi:MAG: glycosyltransferase family 9 protein [Ignavibacteria bacterium]